MLYQRNGEALLLVHMGRKNTPFHDLWYLCKIEETRLKAKADIGPSEENHAFAASYRKKERFGKFGLKGTAELSGIRIRK